VTSGEVRAVGERSEARTKVLLEGAPGVGKTTVVMRLVTALRAEGASVVGFFTEEIRERGRRVGFAVVEIGGARGVLAHVNHESPVRVGRYGVDIDTFERIALPALARLRGSGVLVVDEVGKMELSSRAFSEAIVDAFRADRPAVATVHRFRHPTSDELKARPDVELIRVTRRNRDRLVADLASRLTGEV
jgi:nucleoside-triphosphatase